MQSIYEHLQSRHFDVNLHAVSIGEEERTAVFPLWNLSGQMVGYQMYRPGQPKTTVKNNPKTGRYYTWISKPNIGVWGLESWTLSKTLFITEGVFDAARLTSRGYSAIAMLSNDLSPKLKNWMFTVRASRPVIAVCDNDAAGKRLAKSGHTAIFSEVEGEDLGDASDNFVERILKGVQ